MASQIKVNEIIKQSGSSIGIGETGDTISLTGNTINLGTTGNTVNIAGSAYAVAANTPSFKVILASAQSIAHNTSTVVAYDTEIYDTDNAISSGVFTCPSGKAGKYFFTAICGFNSSNVIPNVTLGLSKNDETSTSATNGNFSLIEYRHLGSGNANTHFCVATTFDLAATDTVKVRIYQNYGSNQNTTEDARTAFSGYKLL